MTTPEKITLRGILGNLNAVQLWGLSGAIAGLLATTFSLGFSASHYLDKVEHGNRLASQERTLQEASDKLRADYELKNVSLNAAIAKVEADLGKSTAELEQVETQRELFLLKSKFLDHYLRYAVAKSESSPDLELTKSLFIAFVHRLWKAQEEAAVNMAFENRSRTERIPVTVARPVAIGPFSVERPTEEWRERTVRERVIKTVTFSDGSSYVVPYEIASEVHRKG